MTTDTTSYPWTLNVVRADDTDATELRYSRNMEEISEEVLDTDFATRLYPLGYGEGVNQLNIKSVNGGTAYIDSPTQALWGGGQQAVCGYDHHRRGDAAGAGTRGA